VIGLRAGPVEGGPDAVEDKMDPRAVSLIPFRSEGHQHCLNVRPVNVGTNRVGEDGAESFLMLADYGYMVSDNSIMSRLDSLFKIWFILLTFCYV
jgi:hypothetical protein